MASLPSSLHQLSLEDNNWTCDCRLAALKRWLLANKTPLAAPARCSRRQTSSSLSKSKQTFNNNWKNERNYNDDSNGHIGEDKYDSASAKLHAPQFIDQMSLDEFSCAPRIALIADESSQLQTPNTQTQLQPNNQPVSKIWPDFEQVLDYFGAILTDLQASAGLKSNITPIEIQKNYSTRAHFKASLIEG